MKKLKLFFILFTFSNAICAPTEKDTTKPLNTNINEINGKSPKDETTNEPETTESLFDKRFDFDDILMTSQSPNQMQIPITTDAPATTSEIPAETPSQVFQTYQEILQSQIYRTFFMLLAELQNRQLLSEAQQEVQESQVIESTMPYFNPSDCSSDDGKVIVFDENSGSYVCLDRELLNQQEESHEKNAKKKSKRKKSRKNSMKAMQSKKDKNVEKSESCANCSIDGIEGMLFH